MSFLSDLGIWAPILTVTGIYALLALGLQVQVGQAGLRNFGHVASMLLGAYTMAILNSEGVPLVLSMLAALAVAMLAAALVAIPTLRLRGDFLAIVTIALAEIVRILARTDVEAIVGRPLTNGPSGLSDRTFRSEVIKPILDWGRDNGWDFDRSLPLLVIVWTAVLVVGLGLWALSRTPWGRVVRAVREDEDAVRALGKNAFLCKVQAMAIGAACAALAGCFFVANQVQFSPASFEPIVTFSAFTIIILGGLGSFRGAVAGAFVLQVLLERTRYIETGFTGEQEAALRYIVVGLVLMALVAFRPQGIFGKREELVLGD